MSGDRAEVSSVETKSTFYGIRTTITVASEDEIHTGAKPRFEDLPGPVQQALREWVIP